MPQGRRGRGSRKWVSRSLTLIFLFIYFIGKCIGVALISENDTGSRCTALHYILHAPHYVLVTPIFCYHDWVPARVPGGQVRGKSVVCNTAEDLDEGGRVSWQGLRLRRRADVGLHLLSAPDQWGDLELVTLLLRMSMSSPGKWGPWCPKIEWIYWANSYKGVVLPCGRSVNSIHLYKFYVSFVFTTVIKLQSWKDHEQGRSGLLDYHTPSSPCRIWESSVSLSWAPWASCLQSPRGHNTL